MQPALNTFYTPEQYLKIERQALRKSEYYQGEILLMAGASRNHNRIKDNVGGELYTFLKGKDCQYFSSDMRLHIPENSLFTYPDLMVICGKIETLDKEEDTVLNANIIIEILSKSTANYDRAEKFELYRQIPAFQEYVLIDSRRIKAEVWQRNENGIWMLAQELAAISDLLEIQTIQWKLSLQDVYAQTVGLFHH